MSLIDDVKTLCDRLAPLGWRDLLLKVSNQRLDIAQPTSAKLKAALARSLPMIDRRQPGFEDFDPLGTRGVAGGRPAQSLLFHALASPQVHPGPLGAANQPAQAYPTLAELDTLENYIYSLVANRKDTAGLVVAVFAYQYREGSRTPHLRHADMAFARTGISRVGTAPARYAPERRSFWVAPENGQGLAVLPARYGVFLARRAKPGAAGSVQGGHSGALDVDFLFPVHKLFNGTECLKGQTLQINFQEFHRNEKLRKIHQLALADGGLATPSGFDIDQSPYVRDSGNGANLVSLQAAGSTVLVIPTPRPRLIRTASQKNRFSQQQQLVHFVVPPKRTVGNRSTRFAESSLEIPSRGPDRLAPEYVNIRHQVDPLGPVSQVPRDLNTLPTPDFLRQLDAGGYAAAHFVDDSCDGCVEALVTGMTPANVDNMPAFSLVTAPDFFPLADQLEVESDTSIGNVRPLAKGRLPANPTLPRPSNPSLKAFDRRDTTLTAVVGAVANGPQVAVLGTANVAISHLPDAASDVFAPGWDTSRSRDAIGAFLTSSGLGSPFPEDAKLCAALASFWPAVAPDNGRTFGNEGGFGNQLPLLDEELGLHPLHERVTSGELEAFPGWDGEFGPFFETVNGVVHVNHVAIERSDYVSQTLAGRLTVALTAEVQSEDLLARHRALQACQALLQRSPGASNACLVVLRKVTDWRESGAGLAALAGGGFLFEFAELQSARVPTAELSRVRRVVRKRHICQVGTNGIAYRNGATPFVFAPL